MVVEAAIRAGAIEVLVATEAAGEGINLQCCHILFNYDIPWNPNRLEQRMGRIHRYGQRRDCLIFNFVATNTIEGRVVMEYETAQGRQVEDVHEKNLGYDITSLNPASGELRLIEIKGLAAATGSILLTPNERRVAEDRRECY